MKKSALATRWIAVVVVVCFAWAVEVSAIPARVDGGSGTTSVGVKETDGQGAIEQSLPAKQPKKKSIMPWILIGVGVVVVAAAVYFFVLNVKYTLTVTLAEGVSGSPAAGANKYKKGESVSYNYILAGGFRDLAVTLDGSPVAASGSVEMKADHTLAATSTKVASIAVNSTPAGAMIYDNGVNTGKLTNTVLDYASPGAHTIIVRKCGYGDYEQAVAAQMGQQQVVNAALKVGIHDNFNTQEIAPCWKLSGYGSWQIDNGALKGSMDNNSFNMIWYNVPFTQTSYTLTSKMMMVSGHQTNNVIGLVVSDGNDPKRVSGYFFLHYPYAAFYIVRVVDFNCISGGPAFFVAYGATGQSSWNNWVTIKVVRSGSAYTVYVNDTQITGIVDANTSLVNLGVVFGSQYASEAKFDNIYLDVGGAAQPAGFRQEKPSASAPSPWPWLLGKQ